MPSPFGVVRAAWIGVTRPLQSSRTAWLLISAAFGVAEIALAGVYLIGGERLIVATPAFVVLFAVPGGLVTHGAAFLLFGLLLLTSMVLLATRRAPGLRRWFGTVGMYATAAWCTWSGAAFALAPVVPGGRFSATGMIVWLLLGFVAWILATHLPVTRQYIQNRHTGLIELLCEYGVSPAEARMIAHRHYGGDGDGA